MIVGGISHFLFGYRYVPMVADKFNNDIELVSNSLEPGTTLYIIGNPVEYEFFGILDTLGTYHVENKLPETEDLPKNFATIEHQAVDAEINNIITSPKYDNSDRIYIYNI